MCGRRPRDVFACSNSFLRQTTSRCCIEQQYLLMSTCGRFEVLSAARRPFMVKSCCFQVRTVRGDFFQQTAGHARRDLEGGVAVEPVKGGHLLILPGAIAVNTQSFMPKT